MTSTGFNDRSEPADIKDSAAVTQRPDAYFQAAPDSNAIAAR
jgi:hypothetical protein